MVCQLLNPDICNFVIIRVTKFYGNHSGVAVYIDIGYIDIIVISFIKYNILLVWQKPRASLIIHFRKIAILCACHTVYILKSNHFSIRIYCIYSKILIAEQSTNHGCFFVCNASTRYSVNQLYLCSIIRYIFTNIIAYCMRYIFRIHIGSIDITECNSGHIIRLTNHIRGNIRLSNQFSNHICIGNNIYFGIYIFHTCYGRIGRIILTYDTTNLGSTCRNFTYRVSRINNTVYCISRYSANTIAALHLIGLYRKIRNQAMTDAAVRCPGNNASHTCIGILIFRLCIQQANAHRITSSYCTIGYLTCILQGCRNTAHTIKGYIIDAFNMYVTYGSLHRTK